MRSRKPLHELTLQEQAELLQPIAVDLQTQKLANGLYNLYQTKGDKSLLTREYQDHAEEVRVNAATGQTRTVRRISK